LIILFTEDYFVFFSLHAFDDRRRDGQTDEQTDRKKLTATELDAR